MKNIAKAKRPLLPAEIVIKLVLPILIPSRNRYLSTSSFCWTPWHVCFAFAMSWIRLSAQHFDLSASGKRRNVPPDLIDYTEYPTDGCCCMVICRCNTVFHNIYFVMEENQLQRNIDKLSWTIHLCGAFIHEKCVETEWIFNIITQIILDTVFVWKEA